MAGAVLVARPPEVILRYSQVTVMELPDMDRREVITGLFHDGKQRLIIRAMERDDESWDREVKLLSEGKLYGASSTLIVLNQRISSYKAYGMIFNPETVEVLHANPNDTLSGGDADGNLIASGENMTLDELTMYITTTEGFQRFSSYNEVNFSGGINDLLGLYVPESDDSQIDDLIALEMAYNQKRIRDTKGIDLPMFAYDVGKGRIREINIMAEANLRKHILRVKNIHRSPELAADFARKFGLHYRWMDRYPK